MDRKRWLVGAVALVVGMFIGAALLFASTEINRYTSTDRFCASCHPMTALANDPHYLQSAHQANAEGVRAGCSDCHIPRGNWFTETYAHATSGLRDVIAEMTHDYGDPAAWEARRVALADTVREEMRRDNSMTCRNCHDPAAIEPASVTGQAAHALLRDRKLTCIDCHFNLVHAPVPPSMSFIRGAALGAPQK